MIGGCKDNSLSRTFTRPQLVAMNFGERFNLAGEAGQNKFALQIGGGNTSTRNVPNLDLQRNEPGATLRTRTRNRLPRDGQTNLLTPANNGHPLGANFVETLSGGGISESGCQITLHFLGWAVWNRSPGHLQLETMSAMNWLRFHQRGRQFC